MKHLDDATIVALRDDPNTDASAYAHLEECATCAAEMTDARGRSILIADALATFDGRIDVPAAKALVRARLDQARSARSVPAWRKWPLGRAAIMLLASAGAASALTWAPLRSLWAPASPLQEPAPAAVGAPPQEPSPEPTPSGIGVPLAGGRIDVIVRGAAPGSALEVAWSTRATARITAPQGSVFTYADGRVEVDAASGGLRVELPRGASAATVEVDGRVYVERTATGVVIHEPVIESTNDLIRFIVPAP
jgi:hypothetical protein